MGAHSSRRNARKTIRDRKHGVPKKPAPRPRYSLADTPAATMPHTLRIAASGVANISREQVEQLHHGNITAFKDFTAGKNPQRAWTQLFIAIKCAIHVSTVGICSDATSRDVFRQGDEALLAVNQRASQRGSWTLYPAEINAIREALELHTLQLMNTDYTEFERAMKRLGYALANLKTDGSTYTTEAVAGIVDATRQIEANKRAAHVTGIAA